MGCTAAVIKDSDALIFVADGRFHLEAAMIRNPTVCRPSASQSVQRTGGNPIIRWAYYAIATARRASLPQLPAYRYDPYSKVLTCETYDTPRMKQNRW